MVSSVGSFSQKDGLCLGVEARRLDTEFGILAHSEPIIYNVIGGSRCCGRDL